MKVTVDQLLDRANMTIATLAQTTGLDDARVEAICRGRWLPSQKERQRIAQAFGTAMEDVSWGHTMNPRNVRYHQFGLREDLGG